MTQSIHRRTVGAALAAFAFLAAIPVIAQTPSDKPLRIIVAGPPGGTLDVVARLLGDGLHKELNQTVVVDLKPGGGGAVAVNDLMQAPHDGNTMLVTLDAIVSEIPHIMKLRFDMAKEIKPIAELARGGLVLVGNPAVPAKNLAKLIAYVKANPGKVTYASYSAGTISHIMGLQLNKAAGMDMAHMGYKGSPPALVDVVGGHVPLMFAGIPNAIPLIKAGKIVPYAVSLPQRSPNCCRTCRPSPSSVTRSSGAGLARPVDHARRAGRDTGPTARPRAQGHGPARDPCAPAGVRLGGRPAAHARGDGAVAAQRFRAQR